MIGLLFIFLENGTEAYVGEETFSALQPTQTTQKDKGQAEES